MKIELFCKTEKITGKKYYFVAVDNDRLIAETWTDDIEKANAHLSRIIEGARQFPEEKYEVIKLQML
jgi:hypothetical protein